MAARQRRPSNPRYWSAWLVIALFRVASWLPWSAQKAVARSLAWLLFHTARERRHIVAVNLRLCFPEWSEDERAQRVRDVFYQNALGLIETANGYYLPQARLREMVEIRGLELLREAKAEGRGVILLGAHYSHLDLGAALIGCYEPTCVIYRTHNNPIMDRYIARNRAKLTRGVIERRDIRAISRALKNNEIVWYPPDQDYGTRHSVWAPFFGITAATITATPRLARLNNSPVLTICYRRDGDNQHYILEINKLDAEFPTGDDVVDATTVNRAMEDLIRRAPTQYMWTHRRFKSQPNQSRKGSLYNRSV